MPTQKTIANNIKAIRSGITLLTSMTNTEFNYIAEPYFSASPGKHFRHILDHYTCFIEGLTANHIDYDTRSRDPKLETDIQAAINASEAIITQLETLADKLKDKLDLPKFNLQVSHCTSIDDYHTLTIESSLERELAFVHSHTTHHFSIIGAILKLQNHAINADFGVAPSTLAYQEQELEDVRKKCAH